MSQAPSRTGRSDYDRWLIGRSHQSPPRLSLNCSIMASSVHNCNQALFFWNCFEQIETDKSFVEMGLDEFIKDGIVLTNRNPDTFG